MSIGQALAEARQQAGLTVADVSQRTRIREGIIRGIEAEDFSVCGGDFYARGHIRGIAKVVGADPVPLVAEYDQVWRDRGGSTDVRNVMDLITESRAAPPVEPAGPLAEADTGPLAEPVTDTGPLAEPATYPEAGPVPDPGAGPFTDPEAGPVTGPEAGVFTDPEAGPVIGPEAGAFTDPEAEPVTDPGAGPVIGPPAAPGPMGEQGTRPLGQPRAWPPRQPSPHQPPLHEPSPHQPPLHEPSPHQPSPHQPDTRKLSSARWGTSGPSLWRTSGPGRHSPGSTPSHRRLNWTAVLAVAVVVAFGLIGYELMSSGGGQPPPAAAPAASKGAATQHPAEHGSGKPVPRRTRQTSAPAVRSPTPTPKATAAPPAASKSLTPASATAFGPSGSGQGDNTELAHLAVDGSPGSAWHTDWYTSASFGNLYSGTGLLVDLGHPATITGARISLGSAPGAGFELRAGSSPSALRTVARADGVSGLVNLRLNSPVQGRYLLIWFTRLPDDGGTFEASVHDVKVTVRP